MRPSCLTTLMASKSISSCLWLDFSISDGKWLVFLVLSLAIIPSQVHGASSSTRSNLLFKLLADLASILYNEVFITPHLDKLKITEGIRLRLYSIAHIAPELCIFWAMKVVLPPGAQAISKFCWIDETPNSSTAIQELRS